MWQPLHRDDAMFLYVDGFCSISLPDALWISRRSKVIQAKEKKNVETS